MATLTYYYPSRHYRSKTNPKYEHDRDLRYMPLDLSGVLGLYDDENKPLMLFWVSHSDMEDGLKTRLQGAFKRKAHHDESGMYSWSNMDDSFLTSYLTSRELFQIDLFWKRQA